MQFQAGTISSGSTNAPAFQLYGCARMRIIISISDLPIALRRIPDA
jgi:hypothetical protein